MHGEPSSIIQDVMSRIVIAPTSRTLLEETTKIAERALGLRGLDLTHAAMDPRTFSVGEFCPRFAVGGDDQPKNLNGKSVYIVMTPGPFKESETLLYRTGLVAQAAREAGAAHVYLLATELPHSRQDRGSSEDLKATGEPTTARFTARFLTQTATIEKVITTHVHSPRVASFYALESGLIHRERPDLLSEEGRQLPPSQVVAGRDVNIDDPTVQALGRRILQSISPHTFVADYLLHHSSLVGTPYLRDGGALLAWKAVDKGDRVFIDAVYGASYLPNGTRIMCNKLRSAKNDPSKVEVEILEVLGDDGDLSNKIEVLADDGVDTAGTLIKTSRWSDDGNLCSATGRRYGRPKDRLVYFTHAWLGGKGYESIQRTLVENLRAAEFVTTNTRPFISNEQYYRFKDRSTVLRFAGLDADAILAMEMGQDVSTRYQGFSCEEEQHQFIGHLYALKRHTRHFLSDGPESRRDVQFLLRQ